MDWTQTLTIIATTLGSLWAFYTMTKSEILRIDDHHREDIKNMDEKWERMFTKMDEKWAILFEKFLSK